MKRADLYPYSDGSRFIGRAADEIFNEIENNNIWLEDESVSGSGSTFKQTKEIIKELPGIINMFKIKSIFDIPCGDFNWFRNLDMSGISYTGGDIVKKIISNNKKMYSKGDIRFIDFNLLEDDVLKTDLVFCRDCLVHFSFADINKALTGIKKSGSIYLMTTTFPDEKVNDDIPTGGWRPINLEMPPFNFQSPILLLNENCTEMNGAFKDKSLGLWKIDSIDI